jgi:hypothetical protein
LLQSIKDGAPLFSDSDSDTLSPTASPAKLKPTRQDFSSRRVSLFCSSKQLPSPTRHPNAGSALPTVGEKVKALEQQTEGTKEEGTALMTAYFKVPQRRQTLMTPATSSPKRSEEDKGVMLDQLRTYYKFQHDQHKVHTTEPSDFYSDQVFDSLDTYTLLRSNLFDQRRALLSCTESFAAGGTQV